MAGELSNVKGNFDTTAEFANANVGHIVKCTVQKTVGQFNVAHQADKTGHANQCVDFGTLIKPGNLDFVIVVDFLGGVF